MECQKYSCTIFATYNLNLCKKIDPKYNEVPEDICVRLALVPEELGSFKLLEEGMVTSWNSHFQLDSELAKSNIVHNTMEYLSSLSLTCKSAHLIKKKKVC